MLLSALVLTLLVLVLVPMVGAQCGCGATCGPPEVHLVFRQGEEGVGGGARQPAAGHHTHHVTG